MPAFANANATAPSSGAPRAAQDARALIHLIKAATDLIFILLAFIGVGALLIELSPQGVNPALSLLAFACAIIAIMTTRVCAKFTYVGFEILADISEDLRGIMGRTEFYAAIDKAEPSFSGEVIAIIRPPSRFPEKDRAKVAKAQPGQQAPCRVTPMLRPHACFEANSDPSEPCSGSP